MTLLIKIITLPFTIIYYIFGIFTGKNNYYLVSKNTTEIYNIGIDSDLSQTEQYFIAGVVDAYTYIIKGEISLNEIYNIAESKCDWSEFLFDFINSLLIVDIGYETFQKGMQSSGNISLYKKSIKKGINDSKKFNAEYMPFIKKVLADEEIIKFLKEKRNSNKFIETEVEIGDNFNNNIKELLSFLYQKIEEKDFNEIVKTVEEMGGEALISGIDDKNIRNRYILLFGIAYQEKGMYSISQEYFTIFMNNLEIPSDLMIDRIEIYKIGILSIEVQALGFKLKSTT